VRERVTNRVRGWVSREGGSRTREGTQAVLGQVRGGTTVSREGRKGQGISSPAQSRRGRRRNQRRKRRSRCSG
jgi:hypothetical protein